MLTLLSIFAVTFARVNVSIPQSVAMFLSILDVCIMILIFHKVW